VSFGSNLRVDLGDGSGDLPLGISPVSVEIPASMNEVSGPNITYTPSPKLRVAPFAIAANMRLRDEQFQPADHSPKLTAWFDQSRQGNPSARRTIRVTLRDTQADNLTIELTECVPVSLDSNFVGLVRVAVECRAVSSVTVVGQPPYLGELLFLPIRPVVPPLVVNFHHSRQLIADVRGGGQQVVTVDSIPRLAINTLHMRAGTVTNADGFSATAIARWIAASLARDSNGQFETLEIVGSNNTTVTRYSDMFLTSIGLINPGHIFGSVAVPPNSVFNDLRDYPPILIGFDLSMLPGQP
jgi:hypothetical protein